MDKLLLFCLLLTLIFLLGGGNCQAQVVFDDEPQEPSRPANQRGQGFGIQIGFGQRPQQGFNNNGFGNNGFGNNFQNPQQGFGQSNNNPGGFGKNPNQGFGNNNQNQNQFEQLQSTEGPQDSSRQPDCRTYQNDGGLCTPLTSCERIGRDIRSRSPVAAARILTRSICGFNGVLPKVCCPIGRNGSPDNSLGNGNGGGFSGGNNGGNNGNGGGFGSGNGGNNGNGGGFNGENNGNGGGFGSGNGGNNGNGGGFGSGGFGNGNNGGNGGGFGTGNGGNNGNRGEFGNGNGGGFNNGNITPPPPFSTTVSSRPVVSQNPTPTPSSTTPFGSGGPVTLIPPKSTTSSSGGGLIIIGGGTNPPRNEGGSSIPGLNADGLSDDCGFSNASHTRIVGGRPAAKGAWPWIAALGYRDDAGNVNYLCGGALISSTFVVTASHCVYKRKDLFSVRLGDHDIFTDSDGVTPLNIEIAEIIEHPKYDPGTFYNDIALIRLKQPVPFTRQVHPICLPNTPALRNERFQSNSPFVAGWGAIQFNGPSSSVLQEVQIPVVEDSVCQEKFKSFKSVNVDDTNICAGLKAGGKDACQGDSGGPLMQPVGANKYVLIGVVSFGFKCAEPGFPGVYSRVTTHLDWIENTIRGTS